LKIRPPENLLDGMGGSHHGLRFTARSEITPYHGVYVQKMIISSALSLFHA
jgi:hypothetical protein